MRDNDEVEMTCAKFIPYSLDGQIHLPSRSDAYVRVRSSGQPERNGSLTVYLPDGTAIIVRRRDLVYLVPEG